MTTEADIQAKIRLALSEAQVINWRNNVGMLKDKRGIPVRYGLCVGSSDIIGIKKVKITEDMVGDTLGVFCAIEVKTPIGRPTSPQLNFIDMVRQHGGIAGVARSVEEALGMVDSPPQP